MFVKRVELWLKVVLQIKNKDSATKTVVVIKVVLIFFDDNRLFVVISNGMPF
jgi:hypothetical protein